MTLTLPTTTLESTSIALRADEIHLVASERSRRSPGLVDFRGDPAKLSDWIGAKGQPRAWQIGGEMTGRVEIADRGKAHEATVTADIDKFVFLTADSAAALSSRDGRRWRRRPAPRPGKRPGPNRKSRSAARPRYDPAAGKITIARSGLQTDWAALAATGTISELATQCMTDLSGEIAYDLALVERKIKTELFPRGPKDDPKVTRSIDTLSLQGQEKRPFVLKRAALSSIARRRPIRAHRIGLVPVDLVGEASLGWQGAQYVGLIAGPADFKAQLKQGDRQYRPARHSGERRPADDRSADPAQRAGAAARRRSRPADSERSHHA